MSLGPCGGSPTHVASRAATEAGCPGALGVPVSRREQAHGRASQPHGPAAPPPRRAGDLGWASAGGTSTGKCLWLHTPHGLREHGGHVPWKCLCPRTQPAGPQLAPGTHAQGYPCCPGPPLCWALLPVSPPGWGLGGQGSSPGKGPCRDLSRDAAGVESDRGAPGVAAPGLDSRVAHGHGLARLPGAELRDGAVLQVHVVEERRGCKGRVAPESLTVVPVSSPVSCGPKRTGASPQALGVRAGADHRAETTASAQHGPRGWAAQATVLSWAGCPWPLRPSALHEGLGRKPPTLVLASPAGQEHH